MKRIAFITNNKILAQSLENTVRSAAIVQFEFFSLLDYHQALLDIEILEIDVALIDMELFNIEDTKNVDEKSLFSLAEKIHEKAPHCRLLLLVSQKDQANRAIASQAKKKQLIDDFIFYDASLKYLLAKMTSLSTQGDVSTQGDGSAVLISSI